MTGPRRTEALIALLALLLFVPGLGAVHLFDWDEINFAEIAREMLVTGDYLRPQMNFEPFYEKPPLFMWMQAFCMKLFRVGEFAARLPNALCGAVTLLTVYRMGTRLRNGVFGLLWTLAYLGSILPNMYFRSGIIDPWFNFFIFLGLDAFIRSVNGDGAKHAALCGLWLGLAVLTKGPVAVLVPGIAVGVYALGKRAWPLAWIRAQTIALAVLLLMVGAWAVVDLVRNGPDFMTGFFWRQVAMLTTEDAGHGGFFGYHFVVLLLGCFPASLFAIHEMARRPGADEALRDHRRWMVILFWTVLILFTIVRTKIVHYSSLCWLPLTYLAALSMERLWRGEARAAMWLRVSLGAIGTVIAVVLIAAPFVGMRIDLIKPLVADPFGRANLDADVTWTGIEAIAGIWMGIVLFLGHRYFARGDMKRGLPAVFGGTALFVTLALFFFINNIEAYSQRAAIGFFEERAKDTAEGRPNYAITRDYKSYAQLFYTRALPPADPRARSEAWLFHGAIDRPVYLSAKITGEASVRSIGTFTELYRKNGFIFYRRDP